MNVYAPYLTLDEARAASRDAITSWSESHEKLSIAEGWNVSNLFVNDVREIDDLVDAGIVRLDEPWEHEGCLRTEPFEGDEAVVNLLQDKVADNQDPTGTYALALRIEHALNSMRFHLWGERYVDSRSGPDLDDLRHGTLFDHDRAMDGLDQESDVAGPMGMDDAELCGWCGEELDQDGVCDCAGAREARQGEVPKDF